MSAPADVLLALGVKVNGQPLASNVEFVSARIERGLCVVGRATLRLNDPGFTIADGNTFAIGHEVVFAVGATAVFTGLVTGVSVEQHVGQACELVVVVDDLAHKLGVSVKPVAQLNVTYADALTIMCRAAGLQIQTSGSKLTSGVQEYLLRTGNGLEFLDAVTRRTGTVWWMDEKTLHVGPPESAGAAVALTLGEQLSEFSVRASGLRPTSARVSGWDMAAQQSVVGVSNPSAAGSSSSLVNGFDGDHPSALGAAAASTGDEFPANQAEATAIATAMLDEAAAAAVLARGTCQANAAIVPLATVSISDAGPTSGSYRVSQVEHLYDRRGLRTRFVAGPLRPTGLVDTLAAPQATAGSALAGLATEGLVVGRVSNNDDPDKQGRVKVTFPALDGAIESGWARVVSLGGGASRGLVLLPEVGDEVLVGFEFGDTRRPVVLGGLFSSTNTLPEAAKIRAQDGTVEYRRLTSRKNHVLEIADGEQPNAQYIKLGLGTAEHTLLLGADKFEVQVASGKPITIKAGSAQFAISASGDVTIEGNNVTIKANQKVAISGQAGASVESTAQTQVKGNMVEIAGQAMGKIDGGGMLTLKGGMVQIN